MAVVCSWTLKIFVAAYVTALLLFLVGTFGWFGSPKDPLAGVFLIPLGLPWNRLLEGVSDPLRPLVAALAPAINLLILRFVYGRLSGR